ncbi:hypothetical protein DFH09DRAFT_1325709 [Mycena vulgaris]|nr:hypothetical protein DFH09DRAFT_1325709 [Mycena vulgaris]
MPSDLDIMEAVRKALRPNTVDLDETERPPASLYSQSSPHPPIPLLKAGIDVWLPSQAAPTAAGGDIRFPQSDADLQSCSLVCRAFRTVSQSLLFETIHFIDNSWLRFKVVAEKSPHLSRYIRHGRIYDDKALHFLCSLHLPQLRDVFLCCFEDALPSAITDTQTPISLESVRRVGIRGYMHNMNIIPTIFKTVSPHLQALQVDVRGASDFGRAIQHVPCLLEQPTVISQLDVSHGGRVTQWPMHATDTFDFTQLTELRFFDAAYIDVAQLLHRARLTIESLSFSFDILPQVNLSRFPRLRSVTLCSYKEFQDVVPAFAALRPPASIKALIFVLVCGITNNQDDPCGDMMPAFVTFAVASLPGLEQLTVDSLDQNGYDPAYHATYFF